MAGITKNGRRSHLSPLQLNYRRVLAETLEQRVCLSASYTLTDLADFAGFSNGRLPHGALAMDSSGNLYGTANSGGASNIGTVFELPAGSHSISSLVSFNTSNGRYPESGPIVDSNGNLIGATLTGGAFGNHGVIYKVPAGAQSITLLAQFNGTNGQSPTDTLLMDSSGDVFGTATGITGGNGAVFELPAGSNSITVLASFNGTNGSVPRGSLVRDAGGNLFGTTSSGGANNVGTIFEVAAGSGVVTTLATLPGAPGAGNPYAGLVVDGGGNLYGTSTAGGTNSDGTIFELPAGSNTITTLVSFNGTNGSAPQGGLVIDSSGNLFGTTRTGGAGGYGTIFELPAGSTTLNTLASFTGTNGSAPQASLIMDSQGNLYGVAATGGASGYGDIFEVVAPPRAVVATQPTAVTAGVPQSITVNLDTVNGSIDTANQSAVTLSIASGPNGAAIGGTLSATAVNGVATFPDLSFSTPGAYTLSFDAPGFLTATTSTITVAPGSPCRLVFLQQPTSATAGQGVGAIRVGIEDAYGDLLTSNTSTVTLSTSTALGGTTSVAAVGGVATFVDLSANTAGTFMLTAADGRLTAATSNPFTVTPAAAAKLVFTTQPVTNATVGHAIGPVVVNVEDAFGNVVIGDDSNVTIAAGSAGTISDGAVLAGTTTVAAQNGVAEFSDLAINAVGTYALDAADGTLGGAAGAPITVSSTAGRKIPPMMINASPDFSLSGDNARSVKVRIRLKSSPGKTAVSRTVRVSDGIAQIDHLNLHKAGVYNLVATNQSGQTMREQFTVVGSAAEKLRFTHKPAAVNGTSAIRVRIVDQYGNRTTDDDGATVTLHLRPHALLSNKLRGFTVTATIINGVATFANLSNRQARGQLVATSSGLRKAVSVATPN